MDKVRTSVILLLILTLITGTVVTCNQPMEEIKFEPETSREAVKYKIVPLVEVYDNVDTPKTENVAETVTEPSGDIGKTASSTERYYNVNLSKEVQDVIFAECEKYGIEPSIVIAMIEVESQFDTYAMGDDGRSFGLMQIQPKWHMQRMIEMDCTDLFEPIQNIKVGISILGDLKSQYNDIDVALAVYNSGKNKLNTYAREVIQRADEIKI